MYNHVLATYQGYEKLPNKERPQGVPREVCFCHVILLQKSVIKEDRQAYWVHSNVVVAQWKPSGFPSEGFRGAGHGDMLWLSQQANMAGSHT